MAPPRSVSHAQPARHQGTPARTSGYEDVDRLENVDHLVGIISRRRSNGSLTFAIHKEFDRDGLVEKTNFIPQHLIMSYLDFVKLVVARVQELASEQGQ